VRDVIVIGGGIAGCATAYYLAEAGLDVLLLEQGEVGTLASGSNAGSLHAQIPHEPFVQKGTAWASDFIPAVQLFKASLGIWKNLEEELGTDLEVAFGGGLLVGSTEQQMREIEDKAEIERSAGLDIQLLYGKELHEAAPYLSHRMVGGSFCPDEGKANPLVVAPAFASAARRRGADVRRYERVADIRPVAGGYAVDTDKGQHRGARIVDAAGVEAGRIASFVGADLPIQAFPIQVSVTEPAEKLLPHLLYYAGEKLTMKQTRLGTILIGGGWPARLDARGRPATDPATLAENLATALEVVPAIGGLQLIRSWAAIVNGTEDWLPILGELGTAPGFFINYVPWMGFTAGPAAARIIADLVQGHQPGLGIDVGPFLPKLSNFVSV
jgi:glycine/D-amino acid oxidase-like deaminating enzyme